MCCSTLSGPKTAVYHAILPLPENGRSGRYELSAPPAHSADARSPPFGGSRLAGSLNSNNTGTKITVMDEKLIEMLKEMSASEPDGQIEIPRRHDLELETKRHRAGLLVDQGHAEWVSSSKVRITASGHEFITELESHEADGKEEKRSEAKQTRWFESPA